MVILEAKTQTGKIEAIQSAYSKILESAVNNRLPDSIVVIKYRMRKALGGLHVYEGNWARVESGKGKRKAQAALDTLSKRLVKAYQSINNTTPSIANNFFKIQPNPGKTAHFYAPCSRTMTKEEYRALKRIDRMTSGNGFSSRLLGEGGVYTSYDPSILATEKDENHILIQVWMKDITIRRYYRDNNGEMAKEVTTYRPRKPPFYTLPKNPLVAKIIYWGNKIKTWGPVEEWADNARWELYPKTDED